MTKPEPESDRGKKISLHPLPFETALEKFLQVPGGAGAEPVPQAAEKKKKPTRKKK
jgi:hypothetical protein